MDNTSGGTIDTTKSTFEARVATARAWVYDYDQQKVVCAAQFAAENSNPVEFESHVGHDHLDA